MKYVDLNGTGYNLNEVTKTKLEDIVQYSREYYNKAFEMCQSLNKDVFYCLKYTDMVSDVWTKAHFFLIPIEREEADIINSKFGSSAFIGIVYRKEAISVPHKPNIKNIDGYEYEEVCAEYLRRQGFENVNVTSKSGDQGIDIIAHKNGLKYGIQCKYYSGKVPNKAVQEAHAGAAYYNCDVAAVITNSEYSPSAVELAQSIGVKLWTL